jgi:hypothetical protein
LLSISLAEESPNPPVAHDANGNRRKQEAPTQNKETEANNTQPTSQGVVSEQSTPTIHTGNPNQESPKGEEERMWPPSAGWATAYIAAAYTVVSFLQWCAIRRTAKIAETSLRKIGRAYLHVIGWQLRNFISGKDAEALCFFVNAGQRPAKLKKNFCGYCFSERLPPIPDYTKIVPTYEGEPIIAHRRERQMVLPLAIYNIKTTDYEAVQRGEKRLYFYGCFIYDDPIDGEHKTTFFAWYDAKRGEFSQVYDMGYNTSN